MFSFLGGVNRGNTFLSNGGAGLPNTTSTTTSTTTEAPTTTSTTTTTTTAVPTTTSTTTTTTTEVPTTTSTTTTTTTEVPTTTSTTTTTTTEVPTTTSTTTTTTTEEPTTTSTTTTTTTEVPTTTSTTTTTTTEVPTTTSTTTTTTTSASVAATIAISYTWAGDNTVDIRANVISGTTLNSLSFIGDTKGYLSAGCSGTELNAIFNMVIGAGNVSAVVTQFAPIEGVISAQSTSLTVNGIAITSNSQTITILGNEYLITGAGNCFQNIPPTTTSTTTTSTTVQPIQAQIFMAFTTNAGLVTDINALVGDGTTLDNLDFSGSVDTYSLTNCTGFANANPFSFTLLAGSSFNSQPFGSTGVSGKVFLLNVSTNSITTSPQTILVGGNLYQIYFFNQCTSA